MTVHDPALVERRNEELGIHVLFVGAESNSAKHAFKRKDEAIRFDDVTHPKDAIEMMVTQAAVRPFDCVIIDMRGPETLSPLNVVAIAALRATRRCVVLCPVDDKETYEALVGVDEVLTSPVEPKQIISTVLASGQANDSELVHISRNIEPADFIAEPTTPKSQPVKPEHTVVEDDNVDGEQKSTVTKGFESSLSKIAEADQGIWQKFVPLANFAYKKLAVIILTALFLTFMAYGSMIVFFMSSSSWSLPFELSRGHALVEKAERDLSSMRLRANSIRQDLKSAQIEAANAKREKSDGQLQLDLTRRTVDEEILLQRQQRIEITNNIKRLKRVIGDFNRLNGKGGFAKNLESAYAKRLITRKSLNSGTLAVLETLHRMATLENEIAQRQLELTKVNRRLEFLLSLRHEIEKPEITVITSAGSDLAHLAREVILAKTQIFGATKALSGAEVKITQLENSLGVISTNIASLEKTPAARALKAPVMVLFVPYTNTDGVLTGEKLFGCRFTLIVCSSVGKVGEPINGETTAVHPLFGKPLRGKFVEAYFHDPRSVTQEIVHANRAPLFY